MSPENHRLLAAALYDAVANPSARGSIRVTYQGGTRVSEVNIPVADLVLMLRLYDGEQGSGPGFSGVRRPDSPRAPGWAAAALIPVEV